MERKESLPYSKINVTMGKADMGHATRNDGTGDQVTIVYCNGKVKYTAEGKYNFKREKLPSRLHFDAINFMLLIGV